MGYHVNDITKGKLGFISKIQEEVDELQDAVNQNNRIMALVELSDLYGAISTFANNIGTNMEELRIMNEATKSAFTDGTRSSAINIDDIICTTYNNAIIITDKKYSFLYLSIPSDVTMTSSTDGSEIVKGYIRSENTSSNYNHIAQGSNFEIVRGYITSNNISYGMYSNIDLTKITSFTSPIGVTFKVTGKCLDTIKASKDDRVFKPLHEFEHNQYVQLLMADLA